VTHPSDTLTTVTLTRAMRAVEEQRDRAIATAQRCLFAGGDPIAALTQIAQIDAPEEA
jgi:hypothetical protein